MKRAYLLLAAAPFALAAPANAQSTAAVSSDKAETEAAGPEAAKENTDVVTTGVARGRDRLNMAISTSSLSDREITKLAPRSVSDLLRAIPGIRSEASIGEGGASISIRGLPIASSGTKFVQLQEDGLPVLEFGDIVPISSDNFVRADLNLAQVETLRGGSSSTFASNSPGGVINFQTYTGEVEGGAVETTVGLDYDELRTSFAYGAPLGDGLRFHIGGFYRDGEGPRDTGYDAYHGGQVKLNITKDFAGGFIRLYGKFLDDATPFYSSVPIQMSGPNDNPSFENLENFDVTKDTLSSRYLANNVVLDGQNNLVRHDVRDGQRSKEKAFGLQTQFEIGDWNLSERFRYSDKSARIISTIAPVYNALGQLGAFGTGPFGGPGASYTYVNGARAGEAADPSMLAAWVTLFDTDIKSLDSFVNDTRLSRVWNIGDADVTTTLGLYNSRQEVVSDWLYSSYITEIAGGGNAALIDITDANGNPVTLDGFQSFNFSLTGGAVRRSFDLDYAIDAPFASINYAVGGLSLGASARYDFGKVNGSIFGVDLGEGRVGTVTRDINNDGIISTAETQVGVTPITSPAPVDYDYDYLSYSVSANYRIAEPISVFGRYSRGARANADRILFSSIVSTTDGSLQDANAAVDFVKQAEAGVKYRQSNLTLNLTAFWAEVEDTNLDNATGLALSRLYGAKGLEFEGAYAWGPLSLTAGATYTDAQIKEDQINPEQEGNTPRHQADLIFQLTPQYSTDNFSVGAVFIGTTESFASDANTLVMPGYMTTNAFVQFRPTEQLLLSLNANNLFDKRAFVAIDPGFVPYQGIVSASVLNGRTISATARFSF